MKEELKMKEDKRTKYRDKYGDIWIRISQDRVRRLRDRNIGGWFGGNSLYQLELNKERN